MRDTESPPGPAALQGKHTDHGMLEKDSSLLEPSLRLTGSKQELNVVPRWRSHVITEKNLEENKTH